jgi:hypothetical protein
MRPITTAVILGGLLLSLPATAQDSNAKGPDANPSKMTADPLAPGPFTVVPPPVHGPQYGEGTTDEFTFSYHGYMSAPILVAAGVHQPGSSSAQASTPLHSLTLALPDYTYNTWLVTNEEPGAWASGSFSMGTSQVFGSIYMGGWDFSQGQQTPQGAAHAQLALSSFMPSLTFRLDNVLKSKFRVDATVGGTRDRYGGSGKWDYGAYGAAVIGASVAIGETVGIERAFGDYALRFEEGFGGNGHPQGDPRATTLLAHAHLIGTYKTDVLRVGLHYMSTFARDERVGKPNTTDTLIPSDPDGSINVSGVDMRFNGGIYGELFLGGSYVQINQAEHVDGTLQVGHVAGGQAFMDNFLGDRATGPGGNSNYGTGSIRNVLFQYDYSFGTLARYPEDFWGNGPDLKLQLFGMYTNVRSADPLWDKQDKLKFGGKVTYSPLSWLAAAVRFDRVIPNLNTDPAIDPSVNGAIHSPKGIGQNFSVVSTRLTFRTSFVAHETVDLQYSRYFYPDYGARGVPQTPKADLIFVNPNATLPGTRPFDNDVVSINGTMWF